MVCFFAFLASLALLPLLIFFIVITSFVAFVIWASFALRHSDFIIRSAATRCDASVLYGARHQGAHRCTWSSA